MSLLRRTGPHLLAGLWMLRILALPAVAQDDPDMFADAAVQEELALDEPAVADPAMDEADAEEVWGGAADAEQEPAADAPPPVTVEPSGGGWLLSVAAAVVLLLILIGAVVWVLRKARHAGSAPSAASGGRGLVLWVALAAAAVLAMAILVAIQVMERGHYLAR